MEYSNTGVHHPSSTLGRHRGVALLMVLVIILAVTVLATGFLARADTELACGGNTLLRMQMDQLAQSGLEHARVLVQHPQNGSAEFWAQGTTSATQQQLVAESRDFYDLQVVPDGNRPGDRCTYDITCEAYRLVGGEKTGRSCLTAKLRLDPSLGLWCNGDLQFRPTWRLYGDVRSSGTIVTLAPQESLAGDAFSNGLDGTVMGQHRGTDALALAWPPVTSDYQNLSYGGGTVSGTLSNHTYETRIWRCTGNLVLAGNVTLHGMLLVQGNLTIRGHANRILAAQNLPALYVHGHLLIENVNDLRIDGLVVANQDIRISAAASNVVVEGALFVGGALLETTVDTSGRTGLLRGNPTWTTSVLGGALQLD
ncbi:MAG: hypothetical protein FJ280_30735, partial [Planctomycetes bacterium]|nr:hypothetical protein [Planctomycetota bacterium]